jgi:hypothetical protein
MADDAIPQDLIDLQRRHAAAVAATRAAARAGEDIAAPMAEERRLAVALHRMREGTPWAAWEQQKRVREAAAAEEGE